MSRPEIIKRVPFTMAVLVLSLIAAPASHADEGSDLVWETDYATAMQQAERQRKMLLIHFFDEAHPGASEPFLKETKTNPTTRAKLGDFVLARLGTDTRIPVKGQSVKVLDHPSFAELQKHQGLVVIDYANEGKDHYGYVVSALPFQRGKYYRFRPSHIGVLLDLPPGTRTQRTMVFAVRIHPEAPASTQGDADAHLLREAHHHSQYQANIRVQGHHHWEHRFPRIHRLLAPFGLVPQEVVAESWPQEGLVDAAVDCVASWRQSPGHWGAVKRDQPKFGYDMRRGSNGIWYATGIFGNRH
jgi:hypothetical protein